jgi:NAD(P)-dependent dehydrogenase (short-subunit alcohol dehydrogenase family)
MDLFRLDGQLALVTGGGRDLGLQIAQALGEAGADLILTSRSGEAAEQTARELSARTGRQVVGRPLDVTDREAVREFFAAVDRQFGRLDILVNNAGGGVPGKGVTLLDRPVESWKLTMGVNVDGMFYCTQEAARIMVRQSKGSIINIASISGMVGRDRQIYAGLDIGANTIDYSAAKGAVLNFTRDAAAELGPRGIRVNAISPGGFERGQPSEFVRRYNERTPLGRMGTDGRDLKGAVVLLASDAGDYITGVNLAVDGGFTSVK